jgi:hypothetical protein
MPWLVQSELGAARHPNGGEQAPSPVGDWVHVLHSSVGQIGERALDVVAGEIELVSRLAVSGMDGDLGRREREDQPPFAGIDAGEPEGVAKESSIRLRIAAVEDEVCTFDHGSLLLPWQNPS